MSGILTPRPADFAEHIDIGVAALCKRYGVGKSLIIRWRHEASAIANSNTVSRDDHAKLRELIATGLSAERVAAMVGCGRKAIMATVAKHNLGPWCGQGGVQQRAAPADFDEQFAKMSVEALAEHYRAGMHTVRRWAKEKGLTRPVGYNGQINRQPAKPKAPKIAAPRKAAVRPTFCAPKLVAHHPLVTLSRHRDMSAAGQAADYLRQFGAVWRCTETGRPDPAGKFWRRGSAVLSDTEIVERAGWMRNRRMAA